MLGPCGRVPNSVPLAAEGCLFRRGNDASRSYGHPCLPTSWRRSGPRGRWFKSSRPDHETAGRRVCPAAFFVRAYYLRTTCVLWMAGSGEPGCGLCRLPLVRRTIVRGGSGSYECQPLPCDRAKRRLRLSCRHSFCGGCVKLWGYRQMWGYSTKCVSHSERFTS